MYKNYRYINAGENEIHRYGHKAVELIQSYLAPSNGYYSIPVDGGKYYTIGTSEGKYGEFCNINGTIFSVNRGGYAYAKEGTDKAAAFVKALNGMITKMNEINASRFKEEEDEEN